MNQKEYAFTVHEKEAARQFIEELKKMRKLEIDYGPSEKYNFSFGKHNGTGYTWWRVRIIDEQPMILEFNDGQEPSTYTLYNSFVIKQLRNNNPETNGKYIVDRVLPIIWFDTFEEAVAWYMKERPTHLS